MLNDIKIGDYYIQIDPVTKEGKEAGLEDNISVFKATPARINFIAMLRKNNSSVIHRKINNVYL